MSAKAAPRAVPASAFRWSNISSTGTSSGEHTSELQPPRDLHSFPTRRSADLPADRALLPSRCRRKPRPGRYRPRPFAGQTYPQPAPARESTRLNSSPPEISTLSLHDALPISRLTERFYRVDVGESRAQGGTGLGLALVKHILNRHRGRLSIESKLGEGSTFKVSLPR